MSIESAVDVIVPVYDNLKMTIDCLSDLVRTTNKVNIIVVDDGSQEPISKVIPRLFPDVILLRNEENLGYAKAINKGLAESKEKFVCLLNNDIRLPDPKWLSKMLRTLREFDLTAPAGGKMDKDWNYLPGEAKTNKEKFAYLVGWCLLFKSEVVSRIGIMPENFGKGFFEDVLFSYRAKRAGFRLGITEDTGVRHLYHATFKAKGYDLNKEYIEKRKIFLKLLKEGSCE